MPTDRPTAARFTKYDWFSWGGGAVVWWITYIATGSEWRLALAAPCTFILGWMVGRAGNRGRPQ